MLLAALVVASQSTETQVWEKLIAPGVTYRMELDPVAPRMLHAVRITPRADGLLIVGELATGKVYDPTSSTNGRETVTETAARVRPLVAVNADFFPFTGDPLGAMVHAGELISSPRKGRAAFCWGAGGFQAAYLDQSITFRYENENFAVEGINQECPNNAIVLSTPKAGYATSQMPATHAILALDEKITPNGRWSARVVRMVQDSPTAQVENGEVCLTYRGTMKERLQFLNVGDEIDLRVATTGVDWGKVTEVIAGGPYLLKDGKPFIPYAAEGFADAFAKNRHPRTAIGRTSQGDVWIVAIDGRQTMSAGATLEELSSVMARLGCIEAINLDGGGSTTLNMHGLTINRPSEGAERPVATTLLVFSPTTLAVPVVGDGGAVIAGPPDLAVGEKVRFRLVDSTGADVPPAEVLWAAQGAGWIDQSGELVGLKEGECQISAWVRGILASVTVVVKKGP